jgi:hypothetical protein
VSQTDPPRAPGEPAVPVSALRALLRAWQEHVRAEARTYAHRPEYLAGIQTARDACSVDLYDLIARYAPPRPTPPGEA